MCAVEGCEKATRGRRKMCAMHEARLYQTGTTDPGPKCGTLEERFWRRVDKQGPGGCWLWNGGLRGPSGYGVIHLGKKQMQTHRYSYELANGPIPAGLVIDHICYVPRCVNPDHLQAVTVKQNTENFSDPRGRGASGIRGVGWSKSKRKWRAYTRDGDKQWSRYFDTIEAARDAVIAKRNELHSNNRLDWSA